ncbi:hypothetical protein B5E65_13040 [Gemmiger sp. An120]|uniref:acetyl-CoA carboxylase biotin carboxyl carrier protein n=1 Tax=Gemmiger sp. An120 TaxID=1965549 RepID=UPI000B37E56D|nr:biotin/lipoyl-containing protein [Gemmiger sp. An120]OUQ41208.1 hypothetical protein B5E65_13040 [Gemmiger sp. An120]
MTQPELFALMDKFTAGGLTRLEYEAGGARLVLEKSASGQAVPAAVPASVPTVAAAPESPAGEEGACIKAPLVGTFYVAPQPGAAPFAAPGARLKKGEPVCVLEAMKMINQVPAPCDCEVLAVLAKDGELVGFDTPLFRIREL